jgi:hypothetical protein
VHLRAAERPGLFWTFEAAAHARLAAPTCPAFARALVGLHALPSYSRCRKSRFDARNSGLPARPCHLAARHFRLVLPPGERVFPQFRSFGRLGKTSSRRCKSEGPPFACAGSQLRTPRSPNDTPLPPFGVGVRKFEPACPRSRLAEPQDSSPRRRYDLGKTLCAPSELVVGFARRKSVLLVRSTKLTCRPAVSSGRPAVSSGRPAAS